MRDRVHVCPWQREFPFSCDNLATTHVLFGFHTSVPGSSMSAASANAVLSGYILQHICWISIGKWHV